MNIILFLTIILQAFSTLSTNSIEEQSIISSSDNSNQVIITKEGKIELRKKDKETNKTIEIDINSILSEGEEEDLNKNVTQILNKTPMIKSNYKWYFENSANSLFSPNKISGFSLDVFDNYLIIFGGCELNKDCYNDLLFYNIMFDKKNYFYYKFFQNH